MLLCAALLAACGSSDSSSSTKTATVPAGTLGAQGAEHCRLPIVAGVVMTSFSARNMPCDAAIEGVRSVVRTGRYPGYDCRVTSSGNTLDADCVNASNTSKSFSAGWQGP
jgi:hypothetical protein